MALGSVDVCKWTQHACARKTEAHVVLVFQVVNSLAAGSPFRRDSIRRICYCLEEITPEPQGVLSFFFFIYIYMSEGKRDGEGGRLSANPRRLAGRGDWL